MAPFTVHVHGLNSTRGGVGTELTTRYEWDFGDPTAGSRYNQLVSFGAAHTYDTPGSYTLQLRVTNQARQCYVASVQVTVSASTRTKIYYSAAGNNANSGASPAAPKQFPTSISSNTELLFKRGDTFGNGLFIDAANVYVSSYDSGARPIFTGGGGDIIRLGDQAQNTVIEDISFVSQAATGPNAVNLGFGKNATIRDCDVQTVTVNGVTRMIDYVFKGSNRGALIADVHADTVVGYFHWADNGAIHHTLIGNYLWNSIDQHGARWYADHMNLLHNEFHNDHKRNVSIASCNHIYIRGNRFFKGRIAFGYYTDTEHTTSKNVVFENNYHEDSDGFSAIEIYPGAEAVLRNNIFNKLSRAIKVSAYDTGWSDPYVHRFEAYNNTMVSTDNSARFAEIEGNTQAADSLIFANNLMIAPNMGYDGPPYWTTGVNILALNGSGLTNMKFFNNAWQISPSIAGYFSVQEQQMTPTQWEALPQTVNGTEGYHSIPLANFGSDTHPVPPNGSVPDGRGTQLPGVFDDFDGRIRPLSGALTAGAVEIHPVQ